MKTVVKTGDKTLNKDTQEFLEDNDITTVCMPVFEMLSALGKTHKVKKEKPYVQ